MCHLLRFTTLAAAALISGGAAAADGVDPDRICSNRAFLTGEAPEDRDVHAEPNADSEVLAQLPAPYTVGGESFATEVSITGSKDGWFRIDVAETDSYIVEPGPTRVFKGEGWMPGHALGLWVEAPRLMAGPSHKTAAVFDFYGEDPGGTDFFVLDRLVACQGYWMEVAGRFAGRTVHGWTDDVCSSQVTTCP